MLTSPVKFRSHRFTVLLIQARCHVINRLPAFRVSCSAFLSPGHASGSVDLSAASIKPLHMHVSTRTGVMLHKGEQQLVTVAAIG